ncbi:septum formation initiator family protein [Staphylococcus sp. SQ8-PEA]|uniref:Septum formation initiator family protein n=1 Tax=Staphylococcus marylandisciuri TaxID=2981529 RepID=A0ABT2QSS2_9STAP|nr:septum formation initiator family protein [Staphylococcus marylandisciuri]MCU5747028.1 septum formation initiator family protein [Staphylococcus marylandisciuri]
MSKKVQGIGNRYTSDENKKKQRIQAKKRVVRRRITLIGGLLLLVIIVLCIMIAGQKHQNTHDAHIRQQKEQKYQKQQDEELALKEKLNNLNQKSYIKKVARDDYYLSNDGEVIFKLPNDKSGSEDKGSKEDKVKEN